MAQRDLEAHRRVIAVTHHTAILALRTILEQRPITDLVEEARKAKLPPRESCATRSWRGNSA